MLRSLDLSTALVACYMQQQAGAASGRPSNDHLVFSVRQFVYQMIMLINKQLA